MSEEDQRLTDEQLRAKARYGNFPPYYKFNQSSTSSAAHGIAYWKVNEIAQWIYARYIVERPDLVTAAEKAGYVRDGFIPTGDAPKPKKPKGKKKAPPQPVTLPSRRWGTGKPRSSKKAD